MRKEPLYFIIGMYERNVQAEVFLYEDYSKNNPEDILVDDYEDHV
jgi:hypothetical protein